MIQVEKFLHAWSQATRTADHEQARLERLKVWTDRQSKSSRSGRRTIEADQSGFERESSRSRMREHPSGISNEGDVENNCKGSTEENNEENRGERTRESCMEQDHSQGTQDAVEESQGESEQDNARDELVETVARTSYVGLVATGSAGRPSGRSVRSLPIAPPAASQDKRSSKRVHRRKVGLPDDQRLRDKEQQVDGHEGATSDDSDQDNRHGATEPGKKPRGNRGGGNETLDHGQKDIGDGNVGEDSGGKGVSRHKTTATGGTRHDRRADGNLESGDEADRDDDSARLPSDNTESDPEEESNVEGPTEDQNLLQPIHTANLREDLILSQHLSTAPKQGQTQPEDHTLQDQERSEGNQLHQTRGLTRSRQLPGSAESPSGNQSMDQSRPANTHDQSTFQGTLHAVTGLPTPQITPASSRLSKPGSHIILPSPSRDPSAASRPQISYPTEQGEVLDQLETRFLPSVPLRLTEHIVDHDSLRQSTNRVLDQVQGFHRMGKKKQEAIVGAIGGIFAPETYQELWSSMHDVVSRRGIQTTERTVDQETPVPSESPVEQPKCFTDFTNSWRTLDEHIHTTSSRVIIAMQRMGFQVSCFNRWRILLDTWKIVRRERCGYGEDGSGSDDSDARDPQEADGTSTPRLDRANLKTLEDFVEAQLQSRALSEHMLPRATSVFLKIIVAPHLGFDIDPCYRITSESGSGPGHQGIGRPTERKRMFENRWHNTMVRGRTIGSLTGALGEGAMAVFRAGSLVTIGSQTLGAILPALKREFPWLHAFLDTLSKIFVEPMQSANFFHYDDVGAFLALSKETLVRSCAEHPDGMQGFFTSGSIRPRLEDVTDSDNNTKDSNSLASSEPTSIADDIVIDSHRLLASHVDIDAEARDRKDRMVGLPITPSSTGRKRKVSAANIASATSADSMSPSKRRTPGRRKARAP
ncbi:MAG: hypothetical protein Q9219_004801 [cf. Caloplaca sp. 3 TL-2023]